MSKTDTIQKENHLEENSSITLSAENGDVTLPSDQFIADADISRDGQDLVLSIDNGESVTIEGYFAVETPPMLLSESGNALTPKLVNSFVQNPVFAQAGGANDVSPVGGVKELSGEATVTRTDGSIETITLGTPIYEGDIIETSGDGAVNIMFIDETEFAVSEDARLAIDEYVFDPSTSEGSQNFSVLRGVFVFTSGIIGRDDPDDVEIETPVGSIGIRGTIIAGNIDAEGGNTQITVIEGAIVVRNGFGEQTLSDQFETVQLGGFNSEITNIGTLDATQMNQSFGSVSGVSGSLFSAINDTNMDDGSTGTNETSDTDTQDASESDDMSSEASESGVEPSEASDADANPIQAGAETTDANPASQNTGLESGLGGPDIGLGTTATSDGANVVQDNTAGNRAGTTNGNNTAPTSTAGDNSTNQQQTTVDSTDLPPPPNVINQTGTSSGDGLFLDLSNPIDFGNRGFAVAQQAGANIGGSITTIGDVDGDGRSDFSFTGQNGQVFTYTSSSGNVTSFDLSTEIDGNINGDISIASGGDIDGDGNIDLIVGTPDANIPAYANTGQIGLVNTANNTTSIIGADNLFSGSIPLIGANVANLGDINGDGYSDFATSLNTGDNAPGGILINSITNVPTTATDFDTLINLNHIPGSGSQGLGSSVSSAGDINNDGFNDIVLGTTDGNAVLLLGQVAALGAGDITTITAAPDAASNFGFNVTGGSDLNRDGFSDLLISSVSSMGSEQVHLYRGDSSGAPIFETTFFTSEDGWSVNGGAMLGDTNGDGIDDFALSVSNGIDSNIFVLFGQETSFGASIDLSPGLFNPMHGRILSWDGVGSDLEIASIGDTNGDGLDDIAIGAANADTNGAIRVVYGQTTQSIVEDGNLRDLDADDNNILINQGGLAIVGNENDNIIDGRGHFDLSVSAGAGDDVILLTTSPDTNMGQNTINGGGGYDTLRLDGDNGILDFTNSGSSNTGMTLSNVEEITLNGNAQTLRLTTADLFSLLQQSDSDELVINSNGAGNAIELFENGSNVNFSSQGFTGELGTDTNINGYYDLNFGNYTILIDTNLASNLV